MKVEWKSIKFAPVDGRHFLGWNEEEEYFDILFYDKDYKTFLSTDHSQINIFDFVWTDLPAPYDGSKEDDEEELPQDNLAEKASLVERGIWLQHSLLKKIHDYLKFKYPGHDVSLLFNTVIDLMHDDFLKSEEYVTLLHTSQFFAKKVIEELESKND